MKLDVGKRYVTKNGLVTSSAEVNMYHQKFIVNIGAGPVFYDEDGIHHSIPGFSLVMEYFPLEEGWVYWTGGNMPEELRGKEVFYRMRETPISSIDRPAEKLRWEWIGDNSDIIAYKRGYLVRGHRADECVQRAIAEELSEKAPEYVYATSAYLGHAKVFDPVNMSLVILDKAAKHMKDRAATYDQPEGERSITKAVAIFNLHHGTNLTEAQGWHFMQILKDVRLFSAAGYHADSAEDCVSYAALKAEAKSKE